MQEKSSNKPRLSLNLAPWQRELLFVSFCIPFTAYEAWIRPSWFTVGLLGVFILVALVHLTGALMRRVRRQSGQAGEESHGGS